MYSRSSRVAQSFPAAAAAAAAVRRFPPYIWPPFHTNTISTTAPLRMLDINMFRKERGHEPGIIRKSQRRRFADEKIVDEVIELDKEWRRKQFELESLLKDFNKINKEVARLKISGGDATELIESTKRNKILEEAKADEVKDAVAALNTKLGMIGNLVHDSVPVSNNEADNQIIRTWGVGRTEPPLKDHVELAELLGIVHTKRGAKVAGGRGYYLKGYGVDLNYALIKFGLSCLKKKGYEAMQPPFFLNEEVMARCAQLSQFEEELYKVTGEGDDKYAIATAEQPLSAYHMDEWIHPSELPARYAGISTCFRKEAGSHGRDTLGLFRTHQFEKVEQFCITSPNDNESWDMLDEMINNSEEFYQKLELPYQVVAIVSGALNDSAAKKLDLEAWFPASAKYRELVSCSNCTDYLSKKLKIRYGQKRSDEQENVKRYAHLLNCTLTATQRTICCILENYQTEDGVAIPKVLQRYMDDETFMPFKKKSSKKTKATTR